MSIDPRRDLAGGGTGLYEFWTDQGVPVRLHDMGLVGIELQPVDRTLILRFEYTEARWTPEAAVRTPVVAMCFADVMIRGWEYDGTRPGGEEPPAEAYGQVSDFEYDNWDTFRLTTYSFLIEFTASGVTVTAESRRRSAGRLRPVRDWGRSDRRREVRVRYWEVIFGIWNKGDWCGRGVLAGDERGVSGEGRAAGGLAGDA
ncbi:hypothetical protein [Kribbella solani]|uniref:Uncharacterized protein n=1 Tax=Kribbella solani TaxID=236067 RepID=A0A841DT57_9ACTN|nr:hypothetical protein [Kribbella solani]MBB5981189.1 hypothetical protein [Kribbella solani]